MSSASAVATIVQIVGYADQAADVVLPLAGLSELTPLVDALTALLNKVTAAAAQGAAPTLAAEVAAADAAAKAAELAAGLK